MNAGNLDRRVQFQRAARIDDGIQVKFGPYENHGSKVWASKTPISDGEKYRAGAVGTDATARFRVRYSAFSAGITGSGRLLCEGKTFAITGLKEIGRRELIEITANELKNDI